MSDSKIEKKGQEGRKAKASSDEVLSSSKATFRIELYEPQGHYRGTIELLQTKEKKHLGEVDQNMLVSTIMDFISKRLPKRSG